MGFFYYDEGLRDLFLLDTFPLLRGRSKQKQEDQRKVCGVGVGC